MNKLLLVASIVVAGLVAVAAYRVATHDASADSAPEAPVAAVESPAPEPTATAEPLKGVLRRDGWESEPAPAAAAASAAETAPGDDQEFQQGETIQESREADLQNAKRNIRIINDAVNR